MAPASGHSRLLLLGALGILALGRRAQGQQNSTLIFAKENGVGKRSCPADIQDCEDSLAHLLCSCPALGRGAASDSGRQTGWFTDS